MKKEIKISNRMLNPFWGLIITLFLSAYWLFFFGLAFPNNDYFKILENINFFNYLECFYLIFLLSSILTFILFLIVYNSELKDIALLRNNKLLPLQYPYKFLILFSSSFVLLFFLFLPIIPLLFGLGTWIMGVGIGFTLGSFFYKIKLDVQDGLIKIEIEKNHYIALSSRVFPHGGTVKYTRDGHLKPEKVRFEGPVALPLIFLVFIPFTSIFIPSYEGYIIDYVILTLWQPNYPFNLNSVFQIIILHSKILVFKVTFYLSITLLIVDIILISIYNKNLKKYREVQWLKEYVQEILQKI